MAHRSKAENADGAVYADGVSVYADGVSVYAALGWDELRAVVLELLACPSPATAGRG